MIKPYKNEPYTGWQTVIPDPLDEQTPEKTSRLIDTFNHIHKEDIDDFFSVSFPALPPKDTRFEYSANSRWRMFTLSVYYADIISYPRKEDQIDFSRLWYILNKFPEGFRVWWIRARAALYPAGYTGWYYVEEAVFNQAARLPDTAGAGLTSRFFLPAAKPTPYIYLFNYSAAPCLKHTEYSRTLIKEYAAALRELDYAGLFCAAVSEDGARVARRFGMKKAGTITAPDGSAKDALYVYKKEYNK